MDENTQKKKNPILRFLAFLVSAALILGAIFLVANWQKLNVDFIRRYFTYRSLERDTGGQVESFPHGASINSSFALLGDDLLVCSSGTIRLYSPAGTAYVEQACTLASPVLVTGGSAGLIYDAGGTDLYVYRDRELAFSLSTRKTEPILSASLSAQGLLTVVTQASGLKAKVTAYGSDFQPLMDVNISSLFITDAVLSPDGRTLALAIADQSGGVYESRIAFCSLDRISGDFQPDAECSLGNNTVLQLDWSSSPLRVLGENALAFVDSDGALAGSYSYGGGYSRRYLKGFSLAGSDHCTLLLGKYRAGTDAQLVTVDLQGQEAAQLELDQQVLSLSSAGRYLSVLTADGLTIYTGQLEPYHTLNQLQGARKVLQREDGSVILIAADTARLYLPD